MQEEKLVIKLVNLFVSDLSSPYSPAYVSYFVSCRYLTQLVSFAVDASFRISWSGTIANVNFARFMHDRAIVLGTCGISFGTKFVVEEEHSVQVYKANEVPLL